MQGQFVRTLDSICFSAWRFAVCFPDARGDPELALPRPVPGRPVVVIEGIVLAAGRSRRMGQPKALLPAAGDTFLQHAVRALREGGCEAVAAVVGPAGEADAQQVAEEARASGARVIELPRQTREQIESLRAGLLRIPANVDAVVVLPVDFPRVGGEVVAKLIEAFRRSQAPIVVPVSQGKHGHPVLFGRCVFPELLTDPLPEGARSVVHAHANDLVEVRVAGAGVLLDVDTPADYRRIVGRDR